MGRHGVYYRATLGSPGRRRTQAARTRPSPAPAYALPASDVVMHDITGASVEQLAACAPSELVSQLTAAARRVPLAPLVAALLVIVAAAGGLVGLIMLLVLLPAVIWLALRDRARRSVIVFYDVNDAPATQFQRIVDAVAALAHCQQLWCVVAAGNVQTTHQWKTNSGASTIINRRPARATMAAPKHLVTNVAVPTLIAGRTSLHCLPDRVLLREGRRYADVPYQALLAGADSTRFIESGTVPSDAVLVDWTWRFVNRNGTPDRRFNNNRRLPVMLYGRLTLATQQGLHFIFDASHADSARIVADALRAASATPPLALQP